MLLPLKALRKTRRFPAVNVTLIALNVLAFGWERFSMSTGYSPHALVYVWGLVPLRFVADPVGELPTLFSSMFLHAPTSVLHIGGNMLFLWVFGGNVEEALGRARYAVFYLLAGLGAAAAQIVVDPSSHQAMVGASGAVAGVIAAYGSLYPGSKVNAFNPVPLLWPVFGVTRDVPAWVILAQFFVFNALMSLFGRDSGVAFFAHLGGFVTGLLLVRAFVTTAGHRSAPGEAALGPTGGDREGPARRFRASKEAEVETGRRGPWAW